MRICQKAEEISEVGKYLALNIFLGKEAMIGMGQGSIMVHEFRGWKSLQSGNDPSASRTQRRTKAVIGKW
jgi:hypothetical protein